MSLLKGAMTYCRYSLEKNSAHSLDSIASKLNLFRFKPLHPRGEDNESLGWVPYLSEYEHEREIAIRDFSFDDRVILSMRKDSLLLPKDLLKSLVKKGLEDHKKQYHVFPNKTAIKEIEIAEAKNLKMRILPKTKIVEAVWQPRDGELLIFSRSKALLDHFIDLFKQTFVLTAQKRDFPYEALRLTSASDIEYLTYSPLFAHPHRIDIQ